MADKHSEYVGGSEASARQQKGKQGLRPTHTRLRSPKQRKHEKRHKEPKPWQSAFLTTSRH
jgi:hypothetical protein